MEEWKKIDGYDNYSVSSEGRVRNDKTGRILKADRNKDGYELVALCKNGKRKNFRVHRLVGQAFLPNPNKLPCIDHINTIRDDNHVENLRWVSYKENNNNPLTLEKYKGKRHSDETKEKMSKAKSGENNPMHGRTGENHPKGMLGKHRSDETKRKLSEAKKGENNPMHGRTGENHPNSRAVIGTNIENPTITIEYASMNQAEKDGFNNGHICECCNGKQRSHKGYYWCYKEDYIKFLDELLRGE